MSFFEGIAIGLSVGVFCPAIARKVKSWFVKETTAAKTAVVNNVAKKL